MLRGLVACAVLVGFIFAPMRVLAEAAPAGQVELKAYTYDQLSWSLRLDATRGCASAKKITVEQCESIATYASQVAKTEPAREKAVVQDGDRYELVVGGVTYPVELNSPRRCSINDDGELECEDQKLTSAEKLLLALRELR